MEASPLDSQLPGRPSPPGIFLDANDEPPLQHAPSAGESASPGGEVARSPFSASEESNASSSDSYSSDGSDDTAEGDKSSAREKTPGLTGVSLDFFDESPPPEKRKPPSQSSRPSAALPTGRESLTPTSRQSVRRSVKPHPPKSVQLVEAIENARRESAVAVESPSPGQEDAVSREQPRTSVQTRLSLRKLNSPTSESSSESNDIEDLDAEASESSRNESAAPPRALAIATAALAIVSALFSVVGSAIAVAAAEAVLDYLAPVLEVLCSLAIAFIGVKGVLLLNWKVLSLHASLALLMASVQLLWVVFAVFRMEKAKADLKRHDATASVDAEQEHLALKEEVTASIVQLTIVTLSFLFHAGSASLSFFLRRRLVQQLESDSAADKLLARQKRVQERQQKEIADLFQIQQQQQRATQVRRQTILEKIADNEEALQGPRQTVEQRRRQTLQQMALRDELYELDIQQDLHQQRLLLLQQQMMLQQQVMNAPVQVQERILRKSIAAQEEATAAAAAAAAVVARRSTLRQRATLMGGALMGVVPTDQNPEGGDSGAEAARMAAAQTAERRRTAAAAAAAVSRHSSGSDTNTKEEQPLSGEGALPAEENPPAQPPPSDSPEVEGEERKQPSEVAETDTAVLELV